MTNSSLHKVRIVLVGTTHPGNIGAVARAMKNMGLSKLYLVNPKMFPHAEATARASKADEVLAQATITETLAAAVGECKLVIGSSTRLRDLSLELLDPRECATKVVAVSESNEVALVFGRESSGLTNDELLQCHYHVYIPTIKNFASLNLAAAVQIIVYELYMVNLKPIAAKQYDTLATAAEMQLFYEHLQQVLIDIDFLKLNNSQLMRRLKRLFNRSQLETTEINILRGILNAISNLSRLYGNDSG